MSTGESRLAVPVRSDRRRAREAPRRIRVRSAPIVEAVGCLSQTGLTDPCERDRCSGLEDAIHNARAVAAEGARCAAYKLLGTSSFSPDRHKGTRWRSGLLIKSSETRINVTSFQIWQRRAK
jgi:hypothetical protein